MNSLSEEILETIFTFLPPKDLITLTLVSHRINNVISKSKKLLSSFIVTLDTSKPNSKFFGHRKYQKVNWIAKKSHFEEIFDKIGSSVNELRVFKLCDVTKLMKILKKCPNLRKLQVDFSHTALTQIESVNLKFLQDLTIVQGCLFLEIFKNSIQLKSLVIQQIFSIHMIENLQEFISSQKFLTSLQLLMTPRLFSRLFQNLNEVQFQLKHFGAIYIYNNSQITENYFKNFLIQHQNSLQSLEISDAELFPKLANFKKLSKLSISAIEVGNLVQLDNVEWLKIVIQRGGVEWIEKFPNVRKLDILAIPALMQGAEKLKKLEEISVTFHRGWNKSENQFQRMIHLPSVKRIKIINFKIKKAHFSRCVEVRSPFAGEFIKLDQLTVKNCRDFEWLIQILRNQNTNLKTLTIEGGKLNKKIQKAIMRFGKQGLDDEEQDVNCFGNLFEIQARLLPMY